jgi:tetratricopeptide (TPR) repeat protein
VPAPSPRLFLSRRIEDDRLTALEFGRCAEGQPTECWQLIGEHAAFLRDAADNTIVGFGLDRFSDLDLDATEYAPLWSEARFASPLLGLDDASAAEIVLAARPLLRDRPTMNRVLFDAAIDAQHSDPHQALGLWLACLESGDMMAHFSVGYTLYELGQFPEAYRHLRHYAEIAPGTAWNWRWYGLAAEAIGERKEARTAYERALELSEDPEETDAAALLSALSGSPRVRSKENE